jgi:tetratricopeptide (TPR) repeat protein
VRLGRLSDAARSVAEIAAVIGTSSDVDFVREVSGGDENSVLDALGELLDRTIVREVGRAGFSFAFTHELIASAVYAAIEERRRRLLHRRVGHVVERLGGGAEHLAGSLAYHFDRGGELPRAAGWYLAAARRAFSVFANGEALAAAERGLAICKDAAQRHALLCVHETVAARLGLRDAQAADIEALAHLAPELADPSDALRDVLWRRAMLASALGELARESAVLAELASRAAEAGDVAREAAVGRALARNRIGLSRYGEAAAAAQSALGLYRRLGDVAGEVECLCLGAEAAVNHRDPERVGPLLDEAQRRAEAAGDTALAARASMAWAVAAIMRRDFPRAREQALAALERYREIGDREGEAEACARYAAVASSFPAIEEGLRAFNEAAEILRTVGNRLKLGYLLFNRSMPQIQLGLLDDAAASVEAAREIFVALDDRRGLACCDTNLSLIRLLQGGIDEAYALAQDALAGARAIESEFIAAGALSNLGNAERERGDREAAIGHMLEAIAIRHRQGRPATFEELSDLALTYLAFDDLDAARRTAEEIERLAASGEENLVWPHCAYWALAQVFRAHGEDARSEAALQHAARFVADQRNAISDDRSRAAFDALAAVRDITAAATAGVWPSAPPVATRISVANG